MNSLHGSYTSVKKVKTTRILVKLSFRAGSAYEEDREIPKYAKCVRSKCHIVGFSKDFQKEHIIQRQLLKGEIAHDLITLSIYKEHEILWKPYLIDDVLGPAYVVSKHGKSIQKITGVSKKNSLTESSLGWACLGKYLKEDNKTFYTQENKYVRNFIGKTVHRGRVICSNRKFVSTSFDRTVNILERYYGCNLDISDFFEKYFDYIEKINKFYTDKTDSQLVTIDRKIKTLWRTISIKK